MRRRGTIAMSAVLVGLGVAAIARTVQSGVGGGLGLLLGCLLVAAGIMRLYLAAR